MLESPIVKEQFVIGTDTVFDFGVKIFDPADVSCYVFDPDTSTEYQLNSGTDFSVGLKPGTTDYENGARITLLTEQPANGKLTIIRSVVPAQRVALPNFGKIPSESLETQLDQNTAAIQQLHETVKLCYKIPYGQSGTLTPLDSIRDIISGMGGGGGGGGAITWVESAGYAEALDSNFVVRSATFATSAQYLGGATKAQILASASSSTVNSATYATSATRVGGATKAQLLASASSSTVNSATSASKLEGATKQQVIDSAVASAGGGGGMQFPNYGSLTGAAYNYIFSAGNNTSTITSTTNLGSGSKYYAMDNGYLRVSLKNASANGLDCLRCSIGGVEIALFDVQSAGGGGSGCLRGATQILPVPMGADFKVYSLSGDWVGEVLVKFDHSVSLTAPPFPYDDLD
ncbi:MAG: hypothetical protein IJT68_07120 [Lentisphaeria bacterium]|nr:hypothetical protein [Lentisphaeria bacterium]